MAAETARSWHEIVLQTLKRNEITLVPYVPDRVLTPLIKNLHADPYFNVFSTAREEEAVGIVSGAWMGGMRGAVLMQTSGFATLANVLASLVVPSQIPLVMFVSERGTLGEFNIGQSLVAAPCARCWIRSPWSITPVRGSTNSSSSPTARSSRPSQRRRRWR
jgi:sulfopyruvate decarboxylase TPP-binding subunit